MVAFATIIVGLSLLGQAISNPLPSPGGGNTIVTPPSDGSTHTTSTTVENVFPPPDPQFVIQTEKEGAPVILQAGLQAADESASKEMVNALDLGLKFGQLRKDLILLPVVQEINNSMNRIVVSSLALVFAALVLWGIIGTAFGSDGREAFEAIGRLPIWALLALVSLRWYGFMLDIFVAIGGVIASSAHGAFGAVLRPDMWSNTGLGLFSALAGLFMFIVMMFFVIRLIANTAFLAFCALVAPVFVFMKATPWTSNWGDRWFRMVPASAGDLLAMLTMLVIGAAILDHIDGPSAIQSIILVFGLLLSIPMVEELFGLRHSSFGGRMWDMLFVARLRRAIRPAATVSAPVAAAASPTAPTRAPRWTP